MTNMPKSRGRVNNDICIYTIMPVELYHNYRSRSICEGVNRGWSVSYVHLERAVNRGFGKRNKVVTIECPSCIHSESDMLAYLVAATEDDRLILRPKNVTASDIKDSLETNFDDEEVENFENGTFTDTSYLEDPDVTGGTSIVIVSYTDPNGNVTVVNDWDDDDLI